MSNTKTKADVRGLTAKIKDCKSAECISQQFRLFIRNRKRYSFSDQGFIITMIGLKMSLLDEAKHPSLIDVVNEYNRSSLHPISLPH